MKGLQQQQQQQHHRSQIANHKQGNNRIVLNYSLRRDRGIDITSNMRRKANTAQNEMLYY